MATTLTDAAHASHPLDPEYVLAGRPLRPDCSLEQTSRFQDDIWRLGPAINSESSLLKILNFAHIPTRFRTTVKELFYAMLAGKLPPGEPRREIATVRGHFTAITRFLRWLDTWPTAATSQPAQRLDELIGADLQAYLKDLPRTQRSPATRERTRVSIRVLWRFRTVIPDHLSFDAAHLDDWGDHYRKQPGENATDRIPEQVHGPLMAWALRFIDDFADDILTAIEQWKKTRAALKGPILDDNTALLTALRRLLDRHLTDNQPLPGRRGTINQFALAHSLGCSKSEIDRHRTLIYATAAIVGVDDQPWFTFPATSRLDGQPWIDQIVNDHGSACSLGRLATLLQTAAYATIAYLSGMRDSEIKDLRRGCLHVHRHDTGRVYRYKVISRAFKGENDPRGVEATWVIGGPAARAIRVLERLQPPETDLLFAHHALWGRANQLRGGQTRALTSGWTVTHLNAFIAWINIYCTDHGRNDGIPLVNGRPWKLTTPQFRRTLAWFIARRPGGSIAGAIAYRHMSIQMFEGYAGTSDSGFRAEVESEQALARGEQLLAMIDRHEHANLAGPAAAEAARRLEQLSQQTHYRGAVITDQRRLLRLMTRDDPAIYPDKYVTCVHTHATALCQQRHDQRGTLRPDIGTCKPLTCRNVALTTDNIDNLSAEITHIDHDLDARPLLPPLLRHQLQARRDDIEAFLTRHNPDNA